jgi:hypothetical protein
LYLSNVEFLRKLVQHGVVGVFVFFDHGNNKGYQLVPEITGIDSWSIVTVFSLGLSTVRLPMNR